MTDFKEYTMTQPEPLETYVGFTEQEVQALCVDSNLAFEDVQKWYDGYISLETTHIFTALNRYLRRYSENESETIGHSLKHMTTIKNRDDVLTLLVHLGYLAYDVENRSVYIPNEEV